MVRLTDRPDMTLDVYHGRKTTMQQQQQPMNTTHFYLIGELLAENGNVFAYKNVSLMNDFVSFDQLLRSFLYFIYFF